MLPEINVLKLLLTYEQWSKYGQHLTIEDFPKEIRDIYSVIDNFHATNSDHINCSTGDLANLLFVVPRKNKDFLVDVLEQVDQCNASVESTAGYIQALKRTKLLREISLCSYEVSEGRQDVEKLTDKLKEYDESSKGPIYDENEPDFLVNDLEAIINKVVAVPGLRWRLRTMNKMLGSLRKGNLLVMFARPETGKTTFLASEVTYMAEQLTDEQGPIIWFNNEQVGEEVLLRLYQASLGRDLPALLSNIPAAQSAYIQQTHDKLKLVDRSQLNYKYIEQMCEKHKPSLVVIDQFPAIQGFKADRKDLELGAIARWTRELAKEYCPVIDVCQADGTGEGVRWLNMGHISDAKTAIQAHADAILGIGKVNDPGYDNLRFLNLSKNKLLGDDMTDPNLRHGRMEVLIEPAIGRYQDIS